MKTQPGSLQKLADSLSCHAAHATRMFLVGCGLIAAGASVWAQPTTGAYPSKPVRIVVPFPPGGASDVMARLLSQKLQLAWGQPVVVENKPGANGNIGASFVVKAEPDGHTLLLTELGSLIISPSITPDMAYSPTRDLAPVIIAGYSPHILVVRETLPVKSVDELVQYAKANKGKVNYGMTPGAITHLAGVLIAQKQGVDWNYIPYKGGGQVLTDLVGGQIDVTMNSYLSTYPLVKGGKLKMLAVASPGRFKAIPDTPAIAETIPGFVTGSFTGILAPARTPKATIKKIHDEIAGILATPEMRQKFEELGTETVPKSPEEFSDWLGKETVFWAKVVKDGNVKVD